LKAQTGSGLTRKHFGFLETAFENGFLESVF
jgi:hypothetical protein